MSRFDLYLLPFDSFSIATSPKYQRVLHVSSCKWKNANMIRERNKNVISAAAVVVIAAAAAVVIYIESMCNRNGDQIEIVWRLEYSFWCEFTAITQLFTDNYYADVTKKLPVKLLCATYSF